MQFVALRVGVALFGLQGAASTAALADDDNPTPTSGILREVLPPKVVQEQRWFSYIEKATFGSDTPIKFVRVAPALAAKGYRVFVLMRKGRGNSEGRFTEEDARTCSWGDQMRGVEEAEPQLDQFVDWVRTEYKVSKVIVMGHSRGGFLSSYFSALHPEKVAYTVNISGGWTTACEYKSNMTHRMLDESGAKFKNQTWVYANKDSYFSERDLADYSDIATKSGINFIKLETTAGDGHAYATANPKLWLDQVDSTLRK
jgi:pimeloyl-ACP methyl ester carboxylesterase